MARITTGWRLGAGITFFTLAIAARAVAQARTQGDPRDGAAVARQVAACDGDTVTALDVHSHLPSFENAAGLWRTAAEAAGLHHTTTQPRIIRAYLRLKVGQICTERDRRESERLLRLQPFIASAVVRTVREGSRHVRVEVETVDEVPVIAGARFRGSIPDKLTVGSGNVFGLGLSVALSGERGHAYRPGFAARVIQYGALGQPYTLAATVERNPRGGVWLVEFGKPFLTDLQRIAFHSVLTEVRDFYGVVRPSGDEVALYVRRTTYDVGGVTRIGFGRTVGVLGAVAMGENVHTGSGPVIVSDSGLVSVPTDSALGNRFPAYRVTRLAAIGGLRTIRFMTVRGFDALSALQDVGTGVQFGALAGPSLIRSTRSSDVFVSADVYAATGGARSFFQLRAIGEGREDRLSNRWDGAVASGRLAWYAKPVDDLTQIASLELAAIQHLVFPLQLTFRDHDGGLRGFPDATLAGGRRAVVRLEERYLIRPFGPRADAAVAGFVDTGKLWAGDVPYGVTTPIIGAFGVSILGAYPAGGKRTYRLDLAIPYYPVRGNARWELRFSSADRSRMLWQEPGDVARARSGAAPSNLLSWSSPR